VGENAQEQQLTRDIEGTRDDLSRDLDELTEKVSPSRVVDRRVQRTRDGMGRVRDRVMGGVSDASDSVGGTASSATSSASGAAGAVKERAEGNPLAAGLIAFGVGWLASSLIPVSQRESQLVDAATDAAKEHGAPVLDEARSVGQEIGSDLKDKATEAAADVKDSAASSGQTVAQEAKSSGQTVAEEGRSSGQAGTREAPPR
jgi:vacuolar-type H+-ATPase subunit H